MVEIRVRELAEAQGLTVGELAKKAHVAFTTVQAIWNNPHCNTYTWTLGKLAKALNVPVTELIRSVPDAPDYQPDNEPPAV